MDRHAFPAPEAQINTNWNAHNTQRRCDNGNSGGYSFGSAYGTASTAVLYDAHARFLVIRSAEQERGVVGIRALG